MEDFIGERPELDAEQRAAIAGARNELNERVHRLTIQYRAIHAVKNQMAHDFLVHDQKARQLGSLIKKAEGELGDIDDELTTVNRKLDFLK